MCRPTPTKSAADLVIVGCHKPDLARQLQALRLVLRRQTPHSAAVCDEPEAERNTMPTRSNASPESEASTDTGTAGPSATTKQGSQHHDTTRQP
jgi:hypothetical protein